MKAQCLIIIALSGFLLNGSAFAQSDNSMSATKNDGKPEVRKELSKKERKLLRKSNKHKNMSQRYRQRAEWHQGLAQKNMKQLHMQRFGPESGSNRAWGPAPQMRDRQHLRNPQFGFGQNPDCHAGPQQNRRFQNKNFGPGMNPDQPMAPRQHMRFRDGKRQPRAL